MIELAMVAMVIGFWFGMVIGLLYIAAMLSMWREGWWRK